MAEIDAFLRAHEVAAAHEEASRENADGDASNGAARRRKNKKKKKPTAAADGVAAAAEARASRTSGSPPSPSSRSSPSSAARIPFILSSRARRRTRSRRSVVNNQTKIRAHRFPTRRAFRDRRESNRRKSTRPRRARGRGRRRAAVRDVHLGWASPDSRRGRPRARRPRRARAHVPDHGRTRERASGAHAVAGDGKVVEPVEGALAAARRGGGTGRRERAGVAAPRATRAEARGRERARRVSSARGLARRAKAPAREERRGARAGRPETRTRTRTRTRGDAFPRFRRARDRTARRFVGIVARGRGERRAKPRVGYASVAPMKEILQTRGCSALEALGILFRDSDREFERAAATTTPSSDDYSRRLSSRDAL